MIRCDFCGERHDLFDICEAQGQFVAIDAAIAQEYAQYEDQFFTEVFGDIRIQGEDVD